MDAHKIVRNARKSYRDEMIKRGAKELIDQNEEIEKLFRSLVSEEDSDWNGSYLYDEWTGDEDLQFTKEEFDKLWEAFVGNECGSDEYRETQPFKGHAILVATKQLPIVAKLDAYTLTWFNGLHKWWLEVVKLAQDLKTGCPCPGYAGDHELEEAFYYCKNWWFQSKRHPYYHTQEEINEQLKDAK